MPNWCDNTLLIKGPERSLKNFLSFISSKNGADGVLQSFDFNLDWYNWPVNYWGTKWNIENYDDMEEDCQNNSVRIFFSTAWSPSIPITYALSLMFPLLTFDHLYCEEGNNFQGQCAIQNGIVAFETESSIDYDDNGERIIPDNSFSFPDYDPAIPLDPIAVANEDLLMACKLGDLSLAKSALKNGANSHKHPENNFPLFVAIWNGNLSIVCLLMANGANVNCTQHIQGESALNYAIRTGNEKLVKLMMSDKRGNPIKIIKAGSNIDPLLLAFVFIGNGDLIKKMIDQAEYDISQETLNDMLAVAIRKIDYEKVKMSIELGATIEARHFDQIRELYKTHPQSIDSIETISQYCKSLAPEIALENHLKYTAL